MANKRNPRRRHRHRGSLGPLLRVLSVLLTAVAIVAAITLFFKVDEIRVEGNLRYGDGEIVEVSQVQQGDNLVLLDKYHIAQRLYTLLPYISDVSFDRRFPDTLVISVRETGAGFAVAGAGAWWLVSPDGKLLEPVAADAAETSLCLRGVEAVEPEISCSVVFPEDAPLTGEQILGFLGELEERGMTERTAWVDLSDPDILVMEYDGRFRVEMYCDADFSFKLDCLAATVSRLQPNEEGTIRMTMKDDSEVRFIPKA